MNFLDNILESLGLTSFSESSEKKAVILGDSAVYFTGVTSIYAYDEESVSLCQKKRKISVLGKNLYLKKFCEGDVVVCGKISKIEFL